MHRKSVLRTVTRASKRPSIGALESFVLSQVGESSVVEDVAETAGLDVDDMLRLAERLSELGVVVVESIAPKRTRSTKSLRAAKVSAAPSPRRSLPSPRARASAAPDRTSGKTQAPPSGRRLAPLSDAERLVIAEMAARIDVTSHYEILGVERDADVKTVRRAYHALAARFHPDRFFGRDLGGSKKTLARIFDRITKAHDTLARKTERAAHDAILGPPPVRAALAPEAPPVHRVEPSAPPRRPSRKMKAAGQNSSAAPAARSRRPAAPAVVATPPSVAGAPPPRSAARQDALFRMYAGRLQKPSRDRVDVFVKAAKEALDRGDVGAAAAHYRLAAQCTDDPAVHAALSDVDEKAKARTFDASVAQARTAESAGRWGEAATKYVRAYAARPEGWVAERAANALRQDGKDLKHAAQLAAQAVLAEPHNAAYRVTLGEIFLDAGLLARAAGESGRASALAPNDVRVRALARRVADAKRR